MVPKRRFSQKPYLGVGVFTATLLLAGMHQRFALAPMTVTAPSRSQPAADFTPGRLKEPLLPSPKREIPEMGYGLDALLQRKLRALLADSQTMPPLPLSPITHIYKQLPALH